MNFPFSQRFFSIKILFSKYNSSPCIRPLSSLSSPVIDPELSIILIFPEYGTLEERSKTVSIPSINLVMKLISTSFTVPIHRSLSFAVEGLTSGGVINLFASGDSSPEDKVLSE